MGRGGHVKGLRLKGNTQQQRGLKIHQQIALNDRKKAKQKIFTPEKLQSVNLGA